MSQVLLFSLTAMVNPTLVAATTVLLILPNPKRLMLGYLLVLLVNVIMLTLIEAPLLSYAIAPDWTPAAVDRAKASFSRHGHQIAVIGLAVIGSLLIIRGLITVLS